MLSQVLTFMLVLTRVSGVVMTAPGFGGQSIPMQIRAFLAISLALLITPIHWGMSIPLPANLVALCTMLTRELLLGLFIGLVVLTLFAGLQLAGYLIAHIGGLQLAEL